MVGKRRDSNQSGIKKCTWPADNQNYVAPCNLTPDKTCPGAHPNCNCSGIAYLLDQACNSCLGQSQLSWVDYSADRHCSASVPTPFPSPLPTGKYAIPSWVLAMIAQTPAPTTFDVTQAQSLATASGPPSSSPTSGSTTPTTGNPTDSASATSSSNQSDDASSASATPTSTPITAASKSTSHAGPIAGGIIGTAILLALVGAAIWYARARRRRRHIAPSAAYKAAVRAGNTSPMPYHPVHHDSPRNSTDELVLGSEHPGSWRPSAPASIRSESRFLEHT